MSPFKRGGVFTSLSLLLYIQRFCASRARQDHGGQSCMIKETYGGTFFGPKRLSRSECLFEIRNQERLHDFRRASVWELPFTSSGGSSSKYHHLGGVIFSGGGVILLSVLSWVKSGMLMSHLPNSGGTENQRERRAMLLLHLMTRYT